MDADEKTCPFCAETIKAAAVKCKHCGSDLTQGAVQTVASPVPAVVRVKGTVTAKKPFLSGGGLYLVVIAVMLFLVWMASKIF